MTPQISGLVNGDVLSTWRKLGIECVVGDNTFRHLKKAANPHHMLYTNNVRGCESCCLCVRQG